MSQLQHDNIRHTAHSRPIFVCYLNCPQTVLVVSCMMYHILSNTQENHQHTYYTKAKAKDPHFCTIIISHVPIPNICKGLLLHTAASHVSQLSQLNLNLNMCNGPALQHPPPAPPGALLTLTNPVLALAQPSHGMAHSTQVLNCKRSCCDGRYTIINILTIPLSLIAHCWS